MIKFLPTSEYTCSSFEDYFEYFRLGLDYALSPGFLVEFQLSVRIRLRTNLRCYHQSPLGIPKYNISFGLLC